MVVPKLLTSLQTYIFINGIIIVLKNTVMCVTFNTVSLLFTLDLKYFN